MIGRPTARVALTHCRECGHRTWCGQDTGL